MTMGAGLAWALCASWGGPGGLSDGTSCRHTSPARVTRPTPCVALQALAAERRGGRSGDADLPSREPLHERRAKFDSVRARQQVGWG